MTRDELIDSGLKAGATEEQITAEMERYRKEVGAFDDEQTETKPRPQAQAEPEEQGLGSKIMGGVGTALGAIDRVTGAPIRAAVGAGLDAIDQGGSLANIPKAMGRAVMDPTTAPTGRQLVESSYGKENVEKSPILKGLGLALDIFLSAENFIPGAAFVKAGTALKTSKAGQLTGKATGALSGLAKKTAALPTELIKGQAARMSGADRKVLEEVAQSGTKLSDLKQVAETGEKALTGGRSIQDLREGSYRTGADVVGAVELADEAGRARFLDEQAQYLGQTGVGKAQVPSDKMIAQTKKEAQAKLSGLAELEGRAAAQDKALKEAIKPANIGKIEKYSNQLTGLKAQLKAAKKEGLNAQATSIEKKIFNLKDKLVDEKVIGANAIKGEQDKIGNVLTGMSKAIAAKRDEIAQVTGKKIEDISAMKGAGVNEAHSIVLDEIKKAKKITSEGGGLSAGEESLLAYAADVAQTVNTTEDVVKARRAIAQKVKAFKKTSEGQGLFDKAGNGDIALMKIYNRFNELAENQILRSVPDPKEAETFAKMFRANNEVAKESIEALEAIKKGAGTAKDAEKIGGKLLNIPTESLSKLKLAAQKNKDLKMLLDDISDATYSTMLAKSITKNGDLDINSFKSTWSNMPKEKKNILFTAERIAEVDKLTDKMRLARGMGLNGAGAMVTRLKTGMGASGAVVGGTAGGYEGGASGAIAGFFAGAALSSPMTALAMTKVALKTEKAGWGAKNFAKAAYTATPKEVKARAGAAALTGLSRSTNRPTEDE